MAQMVASRRTPPASAKLKVSSLGCRASARASGSPSTVPPETCRPPTTLAAGLTVGLLLPTTQERRNLGRAAVEGVGKGTSLPSVRGDLWPPSGAARVAGA
jgi:hypothetical protein